MSPSNPHLLWKVTMTDDRPLEKAVIKVRLLTDSYNLHGRRVHYDSPEYQPHCKLCSNGIETTKHMLLEFSMLEIRPRLWNEVGTWVHGGEGGKLRYCYNYRPHMKHKAK